MDIKDIFTKDYLNKEITVCGWIRNHRKQANFGFISLSDGTIQDCLQVVYTKDLEDFEEKFQILVRQMFSFMDVGENTAENFYHAFVLGMLVGLKYSYYVNSNRESGLGRYDIMLEPKDKNANSFIM